MRFHINNSGFFVFSAMVFLNAFVDLGHKIIVQNTVFKVYDGQQQIVLTAVVNALILLPFILVLSPSGFFSDKYAKTQVMRISAWAAVFLTLAITCFYYLGWFWPAFVMTFLLALQSAFYSPAKLGYIKELLGKEGLSRGNGVIQATTTVAILAGIFVFSLLFEQQLSDTLPSNKNDILRQIAPCGWLLVLASLAELILAYLLPETGHHNPDLKFDWQTYKKGRYLMDNLGSLKKNETIFLSIIGLSIFWSISQVMLAAFPAYAKESLDVQNTVIIQGALACAGLGIMLGSLIAGHISRHHIETGLIPLGSCGIAVCLMLIATIDSMALHALNFIIWGIAGGLMLIPLNALIQFHADDDNLGRILAGNNLVQNCFMLSFLILTVVLANQGVDSLGLFSLLMLVALTGTAYTLYKLPQSLLRFLISYLLGCRYRLHVIGLKHMPETGGVLMLGNHISWIDWAVIQVASPRPIRFVMIRNIYEKWYLRWFLDIFNIIPISATGSRSALKEVNESLQRGDVVCLFPEGGISRNGQLNVFNRGYEKAIADSDAVILPFYLRGLWGSRLSRSSEKLQDMRAASMKRDVIIAFGETLTQDTPAEEVKQSVFELSTQSWQHYTDQLQTLPAAFIETMSQNRNRMMLADTISGTLSGAKLLTAVLAFRGLIHAQSAQDEKNIGLLLPSSSGGLIANMAVLMTGRTVVNLNYTASTEAFLSAMDQAEITSIYTSRKFLQKLDKKGFRLEPVLANKSIYYLEDMKQSLSQGRMLGMLLLTYCLPAFLLKKLFYKEQTLDDTAAILFSSGSEGVPKGVMLSHRNMMSNLKQVSDVLNTEADDVVMGTLPLFHAFGLTVTGLMPLIEGIPLVTHPDPTDALNIAKAIARYRATMLCGTSTFLRLYCKNTRIHPLMLQSLRIVVAGAERLHPDVREAFKLKFNHDIYEGYGATETTPVASVNIPDRFDAQYMQAQQGNKPGTVGLPLPGTSFRIVDPESMQDLPQGESGLVLIGGTQVMQGYLGDPKKTRSVIHEENGIRWYITGDKGLLDEDGYLTIVDRYSRFAKVGGEMISLSSVEQAIYKLCTSEDLELLALNLPDDKKGEKIALLITHELTLEDIKKRMLDAQCNPLMIPSMVQIVDAIPKLGSGKNDVPAAKRLLLHAQT